ncbi:MFS transporter [Falsiroseomonas sp.]|uniref:MFS transporter n=1 Tax=Falsiroseomonas sp. TaxID=2870721 RepID=UPI00356571EB
MAAPFTRQPRHGSLRKVTPAARHALLYAAQFFAFGVILPFLPAVLAGRGLDPAEVAAVLAAGSAVRLVAGPLGGRLADALSAPRAVLGLAAAAAALAASGFLLAAGFLLLLLVHVALSLAIAPIVPLSDAVTLGAIRRHSFDYGRVRAAGSVAFILAALLAGQAVALLGMDSAVVLIVLGLAGTAGAALLLPAGEPSGGPGAARGLSAFLAPLGIPPLRRLLVVSALIQGSHAFYYAFGTIHWQAAGLGAGLIGALWATGVVAEIALFLWGRGVVARLGPLGLSLLAAAMGVLRWGATALTTDPLLLFPLQILHAATFGAQHLATMQVLGRVVPPAQAGTAQALHASLGAGLSMGVMTLASGPLYAAFGGGGYWAMAVLCLAAVPATVALGRVLKG